MPRGPVRDPEFPSYCDTPESRQRWRRLYVIGFLAHAGLSSRFIADAFEMDDASVRRILRSESVSLFRFPKVTPA